MTSMPIAAPIAARIFSSFDAFMKQSALGGEKIALVRIVGVKGSAPRDAHSHMLVSKSGIYGSVGGGYLEYQALQEANALLESDKDCSAFECALGAQIGQCCGGVVALAIQRMDAQSLDVFAREEQERRALQPEVYIFGAGHVGLALARAFALLPVQTFLIESRAEYLKQAPKDVSACYYHNPEQAISTAAPGAAFLVLTHDHGLDFALSYAALKREDATYVGLIGSKTKRGKFHNWVRRREQGRDELAQKLVCPIGAQARSGLLLKDKRPEVIAALGAAEVMEAFAQPTIVKNKTINACTDRQKAYTKPQGSLQAHQQEGMKDDERGNSASSNACDNKIFSWGSGQ